MWSHCKGRCGYHISSFPVHETFHASDSKNVALEEFCCRLCYRTYEHQRWQGKEAKHRPYRDVCWHSYYCEAKKTPHSGGKGQRGQDERDAEEARLRGIDRRCGELWLLRTQGIEAKKPCPFVRLPHVVVRPKPPHRTVRLTEAELKIMEETEPQKQAPKKAPSSSSSAVLKEASSSSSSVVLKEAPLALMDLTEATEVPTEPPTEPPTEAIFLKEAPIFLREAQVQKRLRLRSLSRDIMNPGRIAAPARVDEAEEEQRWMRHGVDLTVNEAWS